MTIEMTENKTTDYKTTIKDLLKLTDTINFEIKVLRHENQNLTATNDTKIEALQDKLQTVETEIKNTLTESKEDSIQTKIGWAHWRNMPDKWIFLDSMIREIEQYYPSLADKFIKTVKTLKKNEIKKAIESKEIKSQHYEVKSQEKKFEYKFTGVE